MALQNLQISNQGELSEFSFSDFSDFSSLYHSTKGSHTPTQESNAIVFNPGRKRKMPNQHYDEHMPNKQRAPQQQHAQQFFCDICKVQLNSLTQAEQHKRGKSHRLKEQNKQSQPGATNPVRALPCDVPFFILTPHPVRMTGFRTGARIFSFKKPVKLGSFDKLSKGADKKRTLWIWLSKDTNKNLRVNLAGVVDKKWNSPIYMWIT